MGELFDRLNEKVDPIATPDAKELESPFDLRAANTIKRGVRGSERQIQRTNRIRQNAAIPYNSEFDELSNYDAGLGLVEASRNVTNFLIGDDAAVVGFKWDEDDVGFSMETFNQQWADAPWWDTAIKSLSLAANFIPVVGQMNKSLKFGKLAQIMPNKSFQFVDPFDGSKSFRWFEKFDTVDDEIKFLSDPDLHAETLLEPGINPSTVSRETLNKARFALESSQRGNKMATMGMAIERGEETFQWNNQKITIGAVDKAKYGFHKRFANSYTNLFNLRADKPIQAKMLQEFNNSFQEFHRSENFGKYFADLPDWKGQEENIAAFWHTGKPQYLENMSPEVQAYAEGIGHALETHQKQMVQEGFFEAGEALERHVVAQTIGTPMPNLNKGTMTFLGPGTPAIKQAGEATFKGIDEAGKPITETVQQYGLGVQVWPDLAAQTLKKRQTYDDMPEILRAVYSGQLITNPNELNIRGLVMDRQIYHNYSFMRDFIMDTPGAAIPRSSYSTMSKAARDQLIDLENIPMQGEVGATLKRIMNRKNPDFLRADGGQLPYIHKDMWQQWFGENGMFHQAQTQATIFEAAVSIHKTMKTAFNPATQATNILGNMAMQSMAGFAPLATESLNSAVDLTAAFGKLAKVNVDLKKKGLDLSDVLSNPQALKDLDLGTVKFKTGDGKTKTFNLNEVFGEETFNQLIEEQAFESVEGFKNLQRVHERMRDGFGKGAVGAFVGLKEVKGVGNVIDKATSWYLMGDMVPKAQMYLKNRALGLTPTASAIDVARHMPMYGTVGKEIARARKMFVPWATFPAEMTRIMKNTMMDNPMRLLPWIQGQGIVQSLMYAGGGMNYEQAKEAEKALPMWARTPTTVVGEGKQSAMMQGGFTGAVAGGIAGTFAGMKGGAAAGIAGGVAGAAAAYAWDKHVEEFKGIRGMTMRFIPHSSVMLSHQLDPDAPYQGISNLMEILPAEPLAIAKPLMQLIEGKTSFGQEIRAEGTGDHLTKLMAGMVGFLAPPIMSNYGFKITSPDVSIGQAAGVEESRTGGVSLAGAGAGALIGGAAGAMHGGLGGAIAGGAAGAALGGIANVSRIGLDTGQAVDPRTRKPKELPIDFILNNFGAMKSYAATPEHRAQIEVNVRRQFGELRTHLKKQAMYHAVNGNEQMLSSYLNKVRGTFGKQNPQDPRAAHREFSEWVDNFLDDVGDIPAFKALGKDYIQKELRRLRNVQGDIQGRAQEEWIGALREMRRSQ